MQDLNSPSTKARLEATRRLNDYIERVRRDWHIPGLALSLVKDDEILFSKGYGVRKAGETKHVTEHTLFGSSSVTKTFTAAAIGLLVDEQKLDWDDPVISYIPDFQLYDPYVTQEITIRDLLSARSGLEGGDLMRFGGDFDRREVIRRLRFQKPLYGFRTRAGSYTFMYTVAGLIIEAVTGQRWESFIKERFFKPLGMNASGTSQQTLLRTKNAAMPHIEANGEQESYFTSIPDNVGPGTGIVSNAVELAQWARLHLNNGHYKQKRILSSEVIRELHTPQIVDTSEAARALHPESHFITYGLGWFLSDYRGYKVVEAPGSSLGMGALITLLPEERFGMVLLTNGGNTQHIQAVLKHQLIDWYLEIQDRDWNSKYLQLYKQQQEQVKEWVVRDWAMLEANHIQNTQPSLPLKEYAGAYEDLFYGTATITEEANHLTFHFGPMEGDLEHWHYDTFKLTWKKPVVGIDFITFVLDRNGQVEELRIPSIATFKRRQRP